MELKAFSVRDLKAGAFRAPFFSPSVGEAERLFAKLVRDPQSDVAQFPEDYQLFLVGSFEDATAAYTALQTPQHLADATTLKAH